MLAFAIIIAALILIALLRFGVIVQYSEAGFELWTKIAFIKLRMLDKDKKKKKKPKKKRDFNLKDMKPGSFAEFMDTLKHVGNALGRLKRRLLIKQLVVHYTATGDDAAAAAMRFGAANATFGMIIPVMERHFRIKRRDMQAAVDFDAKEQGIYAKIAISIAVWEVFYVVFALFPILTAAFKSRNKPISNTKSNNIDTANNASPKNKARKDGEENGKSPNQRLDGKNDAKNEGDD